MICDTVVTSNASVSESGLTWYEIGLVTRFLVVSVLQILYSHFLYFVGKVCQKRNDVAHLKKEDFGLSIGLCGQGKLLNRTSHRVTKNCLTSKCSYCSLVCIINASDTRNSKHPRERFCTSSVNRVRGASRFPVSPKSCCRSGTLVPSGPLNKFLVDNSKQPTSNHVRGNGVRAYYKSEEFDITEPAFESLGPPEGAGEVVLPDQSAPKAAQVPKRWVIVLLCFAAFLLCNMDRVSCYSS